MVLRAWRVKSARRAIDGANRNDCVLFVPTIAQVVERGLLADIETMNLDRGYDNRLVRGYCAEIGIDDLVCARKRKRGTAKKKLPVSLGMRWPVERTNSWFSNFGQLRRNTDRFVHQRLAQIDLAVALILTIKLTKWAHRWSPHP
jgi:hypothetical protein